MYQVLSTIQINPWLPHVLYRPLMLDAGPFLTGNSNADPELNTTGSFLCTCVRRDWPRHGMCHGLMESEESVARAVPKLRARW